MQHNLNVPVDQQTGNIYHLNGDEPLWTSWQSKHI